MDANWWNNALQSYDIGREHRADRENAQAFQDGGYDAVEQMAGRRGDLRTAMTTRRFQDDQRQQAYERMEKIAPWARNVVRTTRNMDPQRARMFLEQNQQRFLDFGFTPEQVQAGIAGLTSENPEERTQWAETLDQAFQQHQNPNWHLATVPTEDGQGVEQRGVAFGPDGEILRGEGSIPVPRGEIQSFGSGGLYRENPNNPQGYEVLREPRSVAADMGSDGYTIVDPAEVEALGLPPGSYQRNNATGQITVLGRQRGQYTESASLSAQFADRTSSANQTLTALEDQFVSPEGVWVARAGFGNQYERQARQAQREFVNAILRRESGAAISPTEFASAQQQYFPQPGDGPAVIEQKRAARARAVQGLINASQGAYDEWYGAGSGAEMQQQAAPTDGAGSTIGALVGVRGAPRAVLERPNEIPAAEWAAMTPEERNRVIQILGRQGAQ